MFDDANRPATVIYTSKQISRAVKVPRCNTMFVCVFYVRANVRIEQTSLCLR